LSIAPAVILPGQLRTTPAVAYQRIRENIEAQFGDRFLVVFQEGVNGKPFCPRPQSPIFCSTFHSAVNATRLALGLL